MAAPKSTSIITRVYTEQDELALLQSMMDYKLEKGHDPVNNLHAFKDFVNPLLSFTATKDQVGDKIRRLKKKFHNILTKGQNPYFSRSHEDRLFQLSKKVWESGDEDGAQVDGDSNVKSGNDDDDVCVKITGNKNDSVQDCWSLYPFLCASLESEAMKFSTLHRCSKEYVKMVISGMDKHKARELEKEWNAFFLMQHQFYAKRTELICKQSEALSLVISKSAAK